MKACFFSGIYLLAFLLPANAQQTRPSCPADCDGNRVVSVEELIRVAGIASGRVALDSCEAADSNADHIVSIDELVDAVANALGGCPGPLGVCDLQPNYTDHLEWMPRWEEFPLAVYFEDTSKAGAEGLFELEEEEGVFDGLAAWAEATDGRIGTFYAVHSAKDAQVVVSMVDRIKGHGDALGFTDRYETNSRGFLRRVRIQLVVDTSDSSAYWKRRRAAGLAAHEMGHALGIGGHGTIGARMSTANFTNSGALLERKDVNTIEHIYCEDW